MKMNERQNPDGTWSKAEPIEASWKKRIKLTVDPVTVDVGFGIGLLIGMIIALIGK